MGKTKVLFSNSQKIYKITPQLRSLIRRCCEQTLAFEDIDDNAQVSVTFVDNEEIHALNKEYRNVDRPTDVLSFPLGDENGFDVDNSSNAILLGDIVISVEKAIAQAEEYGHSTEREIAFLTVHSMLHLLGYDHETSEQDEKDMFARQEEILSQLGITRDT